MIDTKRLQNISLKEMDSVKLMSRVDSKYCFSVEILQEIIDSVSEHYYVLLVNHQTNVSYNNTYFDTANNEMFIKHHNGQLQRFKIRKRSYEESGVSFLEVKFKNNKGRTIKNRINTEFRNQNFNTNEEQFIQKYSPYSANNLQVCLHNKFSRVTLVSKAFNERCTIDVNLRFEADGHASASLGDLAIVEIKTDGRPKNSPLANALRARHILQAGFSKYCIGRTLTDEDLKYNAFKEKIRRIGNMRTMPAYAKASGL